MRRTTLILAAAAVALSTPAIAASKGTKARNAAPGQQMLNERTSATAPGNSFNAPGQKMIRERTPGGTPTKKARRQNP
jgi:hypothetical protein